MTWAHRAAVNLLPRSQDQHDLAAALKEWRYTGHFEDLEAPIETCGLCDHPDIRYQFEIANIHTGHDLLIGSECIHRFGIAATDEEGRTLGAEETRKKVEKDRRKLIEEARKKRVINALVALAHADKEFNIHSFVDYLQTRGAFTPRQLLTMLWRLNTYKIEHKPADFRLTIRRKREKEQLLNLKDWEIQRLVPCLSPTQRHFVEENWPRF